MLTGIEIIPALLLRKINIAAVLLILASYPKILLTFMNMDEYKLLNGWSRDKKRGSVRYDRIPVSIEREMEFTCAQDYVQLIPYDLPEPFTSAQLGKAVHIRKEQAGIVCNILHDLGVMKREGKKGNAYLYRVVEV